MFLEQVGEADDGIHGCSYVVRHVEEEVRLGLVGSLGNDQLCLSLGLLVGCCHVSTQNVHHTHAVLVRFREDGQLVPEVLACLFIVDGEFQRTDHALLYGLSSQFLQRHQVKELLTVFGVYGQAQFQLHLVIVVALVMQGHHFVHTRTLDQGVFSGEQVHGEVEGIQFLGQLREGTVVQFRLVVQSDVIGDILMHAVYHGYAVLDGGLSIASHGSQAQRGVEVAVFHLGQFLLQFLTVFRNDLAVLGVDMLLVECQALFGCHGGVCAQQHVHHVVGIQSHLYAVDNLRPPLAYPERLS